MENNFQKLEKQMIQEYGSPPDKVKNNIDNTMGIFGMVGTIIDLFLTNMINTMVSLTGGRKKDNDPE